ncbi:MAG: PepSY-like domain-containing protein [Chitinophagaceae bacterium]
MKLITNVLPIFLLFIIGACKDSSSEKETMTDTTKTMMENQMDNKPVMDTMTVEIPTTTRTGFEAKYPQASNVKWSYYNDNDKDMDWEWRGWPMMDTKDYVATFNWDGSDYWAWYDQDGNWISSSTKIKDNTGLPAAVNAVITKDYSDYTIVEIDKENDKDREAYEIELNKGDEKVKLLISADGKIMKKK